MILFKRLQNKALDLHEKTLIGNCLMTAKRFAIRILNRKERTKMKRLLFPVIFFILPLFSWNDFCISAPPKKEISRDEVLAKVNGEPLTVGRFYDYLKESKITSSNPEEDQRTKEDELHQLIREILIDQRIASFDLESDSICVIRRDNHMRDFLLDYMYQKDIVGKIEVTDQEVRDHYQEYKEEDFLIPEEVQVRDLLIRVRADSTQKDYRKRLKKADKEAKKKIKKLYKKATAGEDFADLCKQYSQAGVPDITGNLGFIQKGQISPEFDSVAFSLKETGDISKPVRDHRGYHLIQLLDRKEKSHYELDSTLFEGIREFLKNEKIKETAKNFADSLKNEAGFEYNWEILNTDESSFDKNIWVFRFGEKDTIRFGEYEAVLGGYRFNLGKDSLTIQDKKDLLTNYLALPVILKKEAQKRGYADVVEYQVEERAITLGEAERKVLAQRIKKDFPPPTMEEMEAYYQAHKIDFPSLGVPVHVYHIIFDDSLEAVKVLNQIKQGADFVQMAKKYFPGEPEIKDVAYDLGFITQGEMSDGFYHTALNLKEGEVSPPVKTNWGFHLIQVVEKKEEGTTFEEIIPAIKRAINVKKGRKHIADWEKNLFEESDVWINKKLLKKLKLPKPEG